MMRKIWVYIGTIVILAGLFVAAGVYAERAQERQAVARKEGLATSAVADDASAVKIFDIFYQPMRDEKRLIARIEPIADVDVAVKIGGTIEWIGPQEGDLVKAGDPLLRLDRALLEAQVEKAKAAMDLAKLRADRLEQLGARQVTSVDSVDEAQAAYAVATAEYQAAQANLEYTTLQSPISGYVDRLPVDVGEHVDVGRTVMKIVDIEVVEIWCAVPEKDSHYFKKGDRARIVLEQGETHILEGTIDFVALTANERGLTFPLKIVVNNEKQILRPGMIAHVYLTRRQMDQAIGVPFFTILDREDGKSVFVVEDGKAVERRIEYGMYQGGIVEITKGLNVGDKLVVIGQRELVNGQRVRIEADLTDLARTYIGGDKDLSSLSLELLLSQSEQ